ncbi:radial spoke head protein 6 homolog A-like [Dreissena polymorpha]|uniref:radial spoke head protein 6 homolog A-like n=1 Tax=Dreissena polymorpha TaxID=45954 RepID=UPI002264F15E|nr:radial spoke head protein 6 homolog A-like [Dreissena polymorpha]
MSAPDVKRSVRGRRDIESLAGSDDDWLYTLSGEERDWLNAKMFLLSRTDPDTPSLYEHLSELITRCLDVDSPVSLRDLEDLSSAMKRERLAASSELLRDGQRRTATETLAFAQWAMLKKPPPPVVDMSPDMEEEEKAAEQPFHVIPDMQRIAMLMETAGVGLPREEFVRLALALREITEANTAVKSIRYWGKILGTNHNYHVAEAELNEDSYEDNVIAEQEHEHDELPSELRAKDSTLLDDLLMPDELKPSYRPPPKIPCERPGQGLNRKIYYVTREPGFSWTRLPHVTPAQIQVARKIRKLLTGDLDAQVISYPPFPGLERNYLRAQIARISAGTQVSPLGYFRFDDEGEEEEEHAEETGDERSRIIIDLEFDGLSARDLADQGLQAWVHHSAAILPQGRTTWWNPVQPRHELAEDEEGEEDEEERQEPDEPEPEAGPPLLTPLAEDENVGASPAWVACLSSKFVPEHAIAVLQSNTWKGAYAVATEKGRFFENIYIGWGLKNTETSFEPALPEDPQPEFPSGPEVTEQDDPTPEEEAAVRAALQEKELEAELEQGIRDEDDDEVVDDEGGFDEE